LLEIPSASFICHNNGGCGDVARAAVLHDLLKDVQRNVRHTRVGTLTVATIYLQLIKNRYMFRSFTAPQGSPRTPATCVAATTPGLIVRILKILF